MTDQVVNIELLEGLGIKRFQYHEFYGSEGSKYIAGSEEANNNNPLDLKTIRGCWIILFVSQNNFSQQLYRLYASVTGSGISTSSYPQLGYVSFKADPEMKSIFQTKGLCTAQRAGSYKRFCQPKDPFFLFYYDGKPQGFVEMPLTASGWSTDKFLEILQSQFCLVDAETKKSVSPYLVDKNNVNLRPSVNTTITSPDIDPSGKLYNTNTKIGQSEFKQAETGGLLQRIQREQSARELDKSLEEKRRRNIGNVSDGYWSIDF
jgi:hypothetical protein